MHRGVCDKRTDLVSSIGIIHHAGPWSPTYADTAHLKENGHATILRTSCLHSAISYTRTDDIFILNDSPDSCLYNQTQLTMNQLLVMCRMFWPRGWISCRETEPAWSVYGLFLFIEWCACVCVSRPKTLSLTASQSVCLYPRLARTVLLP